MSTEHCGERTEVFSRVVGYYQPVRQWNKGKKSEYLKRKPFDIHKADAKLDGRDPDYHVSLKQGMKKLTDTYEGKLATEYGIA